MTIPSLLLVLVVGEGFIIVLTAMFLLSCWCAGTPSPDGQPAPPAEAAPLFPPAREPCASGALLGAARPPCPPETRIASCMTITTQETHVLAALQSLQRVMVQLAPTEADRATERQLQVTLTEVLLVVTALVRHVQHQEAERLVKELTLEASIQRLVSRQLARQYVQRRARRQASASAGWSAGGIPTVPETPTPEEPPHPPRTAAHEAVLVP